MTDKDQAGEIAMKEPLYSGVIGVMSIEDRSVSFLRDQNAEEIAALASDDENEIPIERGCLRIGMEERTSRGHVYRQRTSYSTTASSTEGGRHGCGTRMAKVGGT